MWDCSAQGPAITRSPQTGHSAFEAQERLQIPSSSLKFRMPDSPLGQLFENPTDLRYTDTTSQVSSPGLEACSTASTHGQGRRPVTRLQFGDWPALFCNCNVPPAIGSLSQTDRPHDLDAMYLRGGASCTAIVRVASAFVAIVLDRTGVSCCGSSERLAPATVPWRHMSNPKEVSALQVSDRLASPISIFSFRSVRSRSKLSKEEEPCVPSTLAPDLRGYCLSC